MIFFDSERRWARARVVFCLGKWEAVAGRTERKVQQTTDGNQVVGSCFMFINLGPGRVIMQVSRVTTIAARCSPPLSSVFLERAKLAVVDVDVCLNVVSTLSSR